MRNRETRFPEFIRAVDRDKDRWHESGESGFQHSGFPNARSSRPLKSRSRDSRSHERRSDVAEWDLQSRWGTGVIGLRDFGVSGFSTTKKTCIVDSRSAKSRRGRGSVGPEDSSGVHVAIYRSSKAGSPSLHVLSEFGVRGFVVSRIRDIAYSDFSIGKSPMRKSVDY